MSNGLTVEINGYELEKILTETLRDEIQQKVGETLGDIVKGQVAAFVKRTLDDTFTKTLAAQAEKVLIEGWEVTDQYGTPTGRRHTVSTHLREQLTKPRDNYNRETPLDLAVKEATNAAFSKEFGAVVTKAAAELKAAIDTKTVETLLAAVKERIGK